MARKPDDYDELDEACRQILVGTPATVRKSKRVILDALGNGTPLPLWASRLVADDLRRCWLNTKAQDRVARSQAKAAGLRAEIYRVAKEGKFSGEKAKAKIAALEQVSVPALNQRLRRAKHRKKG